MTPIPLTQSRRCECLSGCPLGFLLSILGCSKQEACHSEERHVEYETQSEEPQHKYKHDIMSHRLLLTRPRSQDMQEDACVENNPFFWHRVFLGLLLYRSWQFPRRSENCVVASGLAIK